MSSRVGVLLMVLIMVGLLVVGLPFQRAVQGVRAHRTLADLEKGMTVLVTHVPGEQAAVRHATQVTELIVDDRVPGPNQVEGRLKSIDQGKGLLVITVEHHGKSPEEVTFAIGKSTGIAIGTEPEMTELSNLGAATILLMGGFRGLAVDALWLRSIALHEERRYIDERAILDIISNLQPRYASVWVFQAWNIAYNISVQYDTSAEQFKWITEGRDFLLKGEKILPDSADIAFWLGIMYWHKYGYDPAYGELLEKTEEGKNNYEEGAKWFARCRKLIEEGRPLSVFAPRVADSGVFHCTESRYLQILHQGQLGPEGFSPQTLERAEPWRKRAIEEAKGLNQRWPADAVFPALEAKVDTDLVEAYIFHVRKAMIDGGLTEEAETKARGYLDLARKAMAKVAAEHTQGIEQSVIQRTAQRIETCLAYAYLKRANEVIASRANPPQQEVRKAVHWLNRGRVLLKGVKLGKEEREGTEAEIGALLKRAAEILAPDVHSGTGDK